MAREELNDLGIRHWLDIRDDYDHPDILLGNGFSISQSKQFTYDSLFEIFLQNCEDRFRPTFRLFETSNFELILEYLTYCTKINASMGVDVLPIADLISALKRGLIDSIRRIHPTVDEIDWQRLDTITSCLDSFNDIYTTNYDLYLYHIIMKAKDRYTEELRKGNAADKNVRPYNDYFWGRKNAPLGFLEFVDYQQYSQYKHIYYLHGALCIFSYGSFNIKIKRDNDELIDVIQHEIEENRFPVFVSEGTSEGKIEAIYRSPYLRFCLNRISETNRPILIFGNSLSDVDKHILNAIRKTPRKIIYALFVGEKDVRSLNKEKHNIINKFPQDTFPDIEIVDSSTIFI